ncbi:MAG: aspartate 1-decarboxylase [bacterium]|nr:aspartate 1-decarboxylase [bacterium]
MLRAKLHRLVTTSADVKYEGSLTLPPYLMEAADIVEYEAVSIWNVTRGTRLETYAITGKPDDPSVCANGAAAHLVHPGDELIVACFVDVPEKDVRTHRPKLVFVDDSNRIKHFGPEIPGPALRSH